MKRIPNRPLGKGPKPEPEKKPLTAKLLNRVKGMIEKSEGKLTREKLAEAIGKSYSETVEYLTDARRSYPNGETVLRMIEWMKKQEKKTTSAS